MKTRLCSDSLESLLRAKASKLSELSRAIRRSIRHRESVGETNPPTIARRRDGQFRKFVLGETSRARVKMGGKETQNCICKKIRRCENTLSEWQKDP